MVAGRQDENENEDGCIMKRCTTQAGPSFVFEPDDLLFCFVFTFDFDFDFAFACAACRDEMMYNDTIVQHVSMIDDVMTVASLALTLTNMETLQLIKCIKRLWP